MRRRAFVLGAALALPCAAGCLAGLETGSSSAVLEDKPPPPPPEIHRTTGGPGTAATSTGAYVATAAPTATGAPAPPPPYTAAPASAAPTAAPTAAPSTAAATAAPATAAPATAAPPPSPSRWLALVHCGPSVLLDGREIASAAYGSIPDDHVSLDPELAVPVVTGLRDAVRARRAGLAADARPLVFLSADPEALYRVVGPVAMALRAAKVALVYGVGGAAPASSSEAPPTKKWDRPRPPATTHDTRAFDLTVSVLATGAVEFSATKPLPYGFAGKPGARIDALAGGAVDLTRVVSALHAIKEVYPDETVLTLTAQESVRWQAIFPLLSAVRLASDGAPLFPGVRLGSPR